MQTFLPVASFVKSAEFLDYRRLGKQRAETAQILEIILDKPFLPKNLYGVVPFFRDYKGWRNHPAVNMWRGHTEWLKLYMACIIGEWVDRGYLNNIPVPEYDIASQPAPRWLGYEPFHESHRSNLVRKFPGHYLKYWPDQNPGLPYFWPHPKDFGVVK